MEWNGIQWNGMEYNGMEWNQREHNTTQNNSNSTACTAQHSTLRIELMLSKFTITVK